MKLTGKNFAAAGRALAAAALVVAGSGAALAAPQGGAPARPAAGAAQTGRVAVIDFSAFPSQVGQMKKAIDALNAQFAAQTRDLQALQDKLVALQAQAQQGTATPQQQEQMATQFAQMKKEYDRKSEDLKAAGAKAYQASMTPIQAKMTAAIDAFAKARGIIVVIDINSARQSGALLYASPAADITSAFIAEYNKANPVQ